MKKRNYARLFFLPVDGLDGGSAEILAQLLETGTGDGGVEVNALEERVDLNGGLGRRRVWLEIWHMKDSVDWTTSGGRIRARLMSRER
jgi:hypothetical protein